jgi:hypothetical protein
LWLVVLTACASPGEPGFLKTGVGLDDHSAYFGPVRMDFGAETVALPTALIINDINYLAPRDPCKPSLAGVQLTPAVTAVGDVPNAPKSDVVVDLQGPAVLRLHTSYTVPFSCGGANDMLTATTTFTMFHTGRIIRHDDNVIASRSAYTTTAGCTSGCQAPQFKLTSFWAFQPGEVVDALGNKGTIRDKPACITINGHTIAIEYADPGTQTETMGGVARAVKDLSAAVTNWPPTSPLMQADSRLAFAFGTEPASCQEALSALTDPPLELNGNPITAEQGIYVATQQAYRDGARITAAMGQKNGFALMIDLGGAEHARVRVNGNETHDHFVELDGPYPVFWFPAGLLSSDSDAITIETF